MGGRRTFVVIKTAAIVVLVAGVGGCGGSGGGQGALGGEGGTSPTDNLSHRPDPAVALFDESRLHDVSLTMTPEDWQSIIDDSRGDEWRHAAVTYDGVNLEDAGVRPAGESSRFPGNQKMSIRIKFNAFDGRGSFGGYEDVNVKGEYDDPSMMRERLALFVFGTFMPAPKAAHTRLTVNGQLRGLFTLREDWDETSIAEHFSQPAGPLYRIRPPLGVDPYANLGADPASYVPLPWERHIKKTTQGDEVVPAFVQALANPAALETVADVDDLIAYLAAAAILMTTDGLVGSSGASDHFEYFDPQSGKFFVLPWDPDNTFGSQGETPEKLIYSKLGRNALTTIVRDRTDLRARYDAKIADEMAALPIATLQAKVDEVYAQIKDAGHEDPNKIFDNGTFDWNLTDVKDFAAARYANLQMQLGN
jgi:spore coat protein CotH